MRLRHIEVFNAVMATGTVSGAAKLMHVSQPAVSRLLAHAEAQLGFALFERLKGRLLATPEAKALFPRVEQLYENLTEVQRLAESLGKGSHKSEAVHLQVVSILSFSHELLPRALVKFQKRHPLAKVSFRAMHSPEIVNALALEEAQVGFLFSGASHPALVQQELAKARMVCVAPRGMLKNKWIERGFIELKDLRNLRLVGMDSADPVSQGVRQLIDANQIPIQQSISVQTYHGAIGMAHHGIGAILVDSCTAISADKSKVDVLPIMPILPLPVRALRPARQASSVHVRDFIKAVAQTVEAID